MDENTRKSVGYHQNRHIANSIRLTGTDRVVINYRSITIFHMAKIFFNKILKNCQKLSRLTFCQKLHFTFTVLIKKTID